MPDTSPYTAKPRLAFAKLVATPTDSSWAQAYNAGNLFVCLSLTNMTPEPLSLHVVGKEVFNILESEFFTLTEKNIHTIKEAIKVSIKNTPPECSVNLCMAVFKDDMLYVFIAGAGKVILKRDRTIGILLEKDASANISSDKDILSASGYLKNKDTIVLETKQFTKDISEEALSSALELDLPSDIAEALSPQVHKKDDGDQAAIIISYQGFVQDIEPDQTLEEAQEEYRAETESRPTYTPEPPPKKKKLSLGVLRLNHTKKLMLSIAVIIATLLVASIFIAQDKQKNEKRQQLFVSIYEPAKKSYDEGKSIQSLNKDLSRNDFIKAEKILKEGLPKLEEASSEKKQLQELLTKVEAELQTSGVSNNTQVKEVTVEKASLLGIEASEKTGIAFGQNDTVVYSVTQASIESINKASGKKSVVIKNEKDWESPKAIAPYQTNLYLLDQKKGVLKYVASGSGFEKSSYFKQTPNLSKAVSMSIDGSVWILFQDGTIFKYTRGESDGFKASGLDKQLANPTKIFTDLDTDNVYILDSGNSRIVKLSKSGAFQAQYQNTVLGNARDFEVMEKDKKIHVLSEGKVYEIEL